MYTVHNHTIDHQRDQGMKYDAAYRRTPLKGESPRTDSQSLHESQSSVERKAQPWMKNVTLSKNDLMWDDCDEEEEQFMNIPKLVSPTSPSRCTSLSSLAATLSSLPSLSNEPPFRQHHSDSSDENDDVLSQQLPRFRQDLIMDHSDVELQVNSLQTSLQRSISSDSIPIPALIESTLNFSESFVASQKQILQHIQHNSASNSQSSLHLPNEQQPPSSPWSTSGNQSFREETFDGNGSKIRIHDKERVYAAMNQGTARILQCIGCSKHMMATSDIELVFCPACGTVTPLDIARVQSDALDASQPTLPRR